MIHCARLSCYDIQQFLCKVGRSRRTGNLAALLLYLYYINGWLQCSSIVSLILRPSAFQKVKGRLSPVNVMHTNWFMAPTTLAKQCT